MPKGFCIDAWNAIVGYSFPKICTQRRTAHEVDSHAAVVQGAAEGEELVHLVNRREQRHDPAYQLPPGATGTGIELHNPSYS